MLEEPGHFPEHERKIMLKSFGFTGGNEYKIDSKGRLNIPAKMKRILAPDIRDEVIITLGREGHLSLFSNDYWEQVILQNFIDRADGSNDPAIWRKIQMISKNSHPSNVDGQGRITIPRKLLVSSGIQDMALVIGSIDRVNVWNPERFDQWVAREMDDDDQNGIYI